QHQQIEAQYQVPQFNVNAIPSAATHDMVAQPAPPQPRIAQPRVSPPLPPTPASIAGFSTPGYPQAVMCPTCRRMGPPGKFCQDCGTKLPMPDLFCPQCAAPVENSSRFCPECGTKLQMAL
ncbi:MAG: zinc ribbon domain-containing protein, partial [Chloroflexota bacterium]|nr:zinc ribbon domain-containing protein [Chloroflexota bacterium]